MTYAHCYASLLGTDPAYITQGRMTFDLRRLRLHGLIDSSTTPTAAA